MAQYDDAAKHLMLRNADTLLPYLLDAPDVKVLKRLDTEQPTLKTHHADSTWEVSIDGEESISHLEVQTHTSREPMQFRLAGYHGFLIAAHKKPVRCTVLYLHPRAGRNDPGGYGYEWNGTPCYLLSYRVLRLREIDGASVLALQAPGLMPLTPLMQPPENMSAERWLKECIDATHSLSVSVEHRHDLLALLGVFGKLGYDEELLMSSLTEDMVKDSLFWQRYFEPAVEQAREQALEQAQEQAREQAREQAQQAREQAQQAREQAQEQAREQAQQAREQAQQAREQGLRQGRGQGERDATIRAILSFLEARFQTPGVRSLKPLLEMIDDMERLEQLAPAAAQAESLEMFLEALNE